MVDYKLITIYFHAMIERKIKPQLMAALSDSPVVLIHGARQTGKSTLVKSIAEDDYPAKYITFDDSSILSAALNNPYDFITGYQENLIIDEVQRSPEIFLAIKSSVDKNRKPGKFILTGSANVLLLPKISESLAGRMEILRLYPLAQNEISECKNNLVEEISKNNFNLNYRVTSDNFINKVLSGGFPEMLTRQDRKRQKAWFSSYITTILQRDVRDVANIEKLNDLPKLLRLFASRAGTMLNYAEFSRSSAIPQTTLKRYVSLFEAIFMIHIVPAWSGNLSKRLIKTPKLYLNDTGLLSHLIGFEPERIISDALMWGRILENFVLMEMLKQSSWSDLVLSLYHYRTASGQEIDFIIERNDGKVIAVEVKATSKIDAKDFNHIKVFADETKDKFLRGILFYTGSEIIPFSKNLIALPINALW
jgi:predicted AAA+ superfamily ATPase